MYKMTLKDRIYIYIKHPKCIFYDIRDKWSRRKSDLEFWIRRKVISHILHSEKYSYQYYLGNEKPVFKSAVLYPLNTVYMILSMYFKDLETLKIFEISVDLFSNKKQYIVSISLHRPGLLIGKGGKDMLAIQDRLTAVFGKKTTINITDVHDINQYKIYAYYENF